MSIKNYKTENEIDDLNFIIEKLHKINKRVDDIISDLQDLLNDKQQSFLK